MEPWHLTHGEKATILELLTTLCQCRAQAAQPPVVTSETVNLNPIIRNKKITDTTVEIGKIDGELDEFYKKQRTNVSGTLKSRDGQPAFLSLSLNSERYSITCMTKAYFDCFRNYDNNEINHVKSHNQALFLAAARRRVVEFAQSGTEGAPIVDSEDRIDRVEPLVLASDLVPAMMDTWTELARSTRTRR
ncbi:hypothetical protein B0J15DRAFT_588240 [Fusarium solani]|uniref:Uncharacterized protein n=1 Tax=Fusarium solani TaxID=169388 RepID=A0A9P9RDN1_FUSSL|nr:uncharacterized protein B0J15DRAFT_588240 [Fusarium solani]KAH7275751.1 hypothetical protein B0J15DRAFT_588240 [Fusarium solani]